MALLDDIRVKVKSGNPVTRLIIINIGVFLVISVLRILNFLSGESSLMAYLEYQVQHNMALPLSFQGLAVRPWTLITYMFTHIQLMHIFWNMITLYWFGQILSEYMNPRKLTPLYIYGGIIGALLTMVLFTVVPAFRPYLGAPLVGASAGVTAIIIAAATLVPNVQIGILFLGQVRLLYVALFVVFIDVLSVASYDNVGGNLSHLGGAMMGYFFIKQFRRGNDLSRGLTVFFDWLKRIFGGSSKMKVVHNRKKKSDEEFNLERNAMQQRVDEILDKISRSGYESLSKEEKDILFKSSNKL